MLRSEETKIAKEKFYTGKKKMNICDVNVDNSYLKISCINCKYLIGYLDMLTHFQLIRNH